MSRRASLSWWCWLALLALTESATAQTTITVDPATRFQTLTGWECVSFAAQDDLAFPAFKDTLFDRVINEAGIRKVHDPLVALAEGTTRFNAADVDSDERLSRAHCSGSISALWNPVRQVPDSTWPAL